jgi:hypothetical protein
MGTRLYDEFMKKLKIPSVQKFNKKSDTPEVVIAIPLKGGGGVFSFF